MKYKLQILGGLVSAILVWLLLIVGDSIDELVLDTDSFFGAIVFFIEPIVMFIYFIVHFIKTKPPLINLFFWFLFFDLFGSFLWLIIYLLGESGHFPVPQGDRSSMFNFNGIEYIFYGFTSILGYTTLCIVFYGLYRLIHHIKSKSINEKVK